MIYVDDFMAEYRKGSRRMRMSHLYSIPPDDKELILFAESIGLKPEWFQHSTTLNHFDVSVKMRLKAIAAGATPVTAREGMKIFLDWRKKRKSKTKGASHDRSTKAAV